MKIDNYCFVSRFALLAVFCLAVLVHASPAVAVEVENDEVYRIVLDENAVQANHIVDGVPYAAVGQPFFLVVKAGHVEVPEGSFRVVNISAQPEETGSTAEYVKPKIRTGYPESQIHFAQRGRYSLLVQVSDVCKTSCAGVTLSPVMERRLSVLVR
ncbi:hypothetical protein [Oleidesulfovibrio sp.]|uniref:hypothetical protein n=1 Tax=Oleidesulfovibrio sp. TaxID=2909707 RepID=UPI003A8BF97F